MSFTSIHCIQDAGCILHVRGNFCCLFFNLKKIEKRILVIKLCNLCSSYSVVAGLQIFLFVFNNSSHLYDVAFACLIIGKQQSKKILQPTQRAVFANILHY